MRYLLNIPLVFAIASSWWIFYLIILANSGSNDAQAGAAYVAVFGTPISWVMFAIVLAGCAAMGTFTWLPIAGGGAALVILLAYCGLVLISLMPTYIAIEANGGGEKWGIDQIWPARLVAGGLPLVLSLYLAWTINAPESIRNSRMLLLTVLGAVAILTIAGGVVTTRERIRSARIEAADSAVRDQQEAARVEEGRRAFEALTDADPLLAWDQYAGYNVPDDVRIEALRRIGLRPTLEAELTEALACENTNWTREALSLIVRVPFAPTAALAEPVRNALAVLIGELREGATHDTYDGDKRLDYYEQRTLRSTLAVAERLAETTGADLSDKVTEMQQAVALYPNSDMAHDFPGRAAETRKTIVKILAARHG